MNFNYTANMQTIGRGPKSHRSVGRFSSTMYKNNSRFSSKFKGCSLLQNCGGLISLKPTIAYFAYTYP